MKNTAFLPCSKSSMHSIKAPLHTQGTAQLENESHKDAESERFYVRKCTRLIATPPKSLAVKIMPSLKCLSSSMTRKRN